MKNMMKYKGYYGSVNFDADDLVFYGKLEFINSLISYEGETAKEIDAAFKEGKRLINPIFLRHDQLRYASHIA